jgi:hypothetical protein
MRVKLNQSIERLRSLLLIGILAFGLITIIGSNGGGNGGTTEPEVEAIIGPEGGVVEIQFSDNTEAKLEIPEGALSETKMIRISASERGVPDSIDIAPAIKLGPDGTAFEAPVTLSVRVTEQNIRNAGLTSLEESSEFLKVYLFNAASQTWEPLVIKDCNYDQNLISIEIRHFSIVHFVVGEYNVDRLRFAAPVKKGYPMNFTIAVSYKLHGPDIPVPVEFEARLEGHEGIIEPENIQLQPAPEYPAETKVEFAELVPPDSGKFENLIIVSDYSGIKIKLWEQKVVVDYPEPVLEDLESKLDDYRPVLQFAHNEKFFPVQVDEIFNVNKALRKADLIDEYVSENLVADDLAVYSSISHYVSGYDGQSFENTFEDTDKRIYATAIENNDYLYLIYIFYYHRDTKSSEIAPFAPHDCDTERITVLLEKAGEDYEPISVVYGHHLGYRELVTEGIIALDYGKVWGKGHVMVPWANVNKHEETHPYVYIAQGSHACYPRPGTYAITHGCQVDDIREYLDPISPPYYIEDIEKLGCLAEDGVLQEEAGVGKTWYPSKDELIVIPRLTEIDSNSNFNFLLFSGSMGDWGPCEVEEGTERILWGNVKIMSQQEWWLSPSDPNRFFDTNNEREFPILPRYEQIFTHDSSVTSPIPILLVHGDRSENEPKARWGTLESIINSPEYSSDYKQFDVYIWYHDTSKPIGFNGDTGNAAELADFIMNKCDPGTKLLFVAHSRGGLVCRSYMNHDYDGDGILEGENVLGLITLGTPHHGSPAAVPDWAAFAFDEQFFELSPVFFNWLYGPYKVFDPYRVGSINLAWDNLDEALPAGVRSIQYDADISTDGEMYFTVRDMNQRVSTEYQDETMFFQDQWCLSDYKSQYGTLYELNQKEKYARKIIAFAAYDDNLLNNGWLQNIIQAVLKWDHSSLKIATLLLAGFDVDGVTRDDIKFYANDGMVPLQSALYLDISMGSTFCSDDSGHIRLDTNEIWDKRLVKDHYIFTGSVKDHLDLLDTNEDTYWINITNAVNHLSSGTD